MKVKGNVLFYLLGLLLVSSLVGCDDDPINSPGVSTISYLLDGEPIDHRAVGVVNIYDRLEDSIVVELNKTQLETPFITLYYNVESSVNLEGSFTFDAEENSGIFLEIFDGQGIVIFSTSFCPSVSGQVSITEHDADQRQLSGTFSGTVCDNSGNTLNITEGVFTNVRYVMQIQE